jgi:site-specific DNA-cytosine methylase
METNFITIQEASEISQKSIQTIRRAIKSKKLKVRRMKTPQGFNYLIDKEMLFSLYRIKTTEKAAQETQKETTFDTDVRTTSRVNKVGSDMITADEFRDFTKVLEKMVNQHSDERQNFMRLVNTLQEKIFVLENQMNLLKAPAKKWFQVWK